VALLVLAKTVSLPGTERVGVWCCQNKERERESTNEGQKERRKKVRVAASAVKSKNFCVQFAFVDGCGPSPLASPAPSRPVTITALEP
jgi:hypothetical protein